MIIDSSHYSIHDLRRIVQEKWDFLAKSGYGMRLYFITFGFKYGAPAEADLMFDLRFLPNPYFDERLQTGLPFPDRFPENRYGAKRR